MLFWNWGSSRDAQIICALRVSGRNTGQEFMGCLLLWLGWQGGGKPGLYSYPPCYPRPPHTVHPRPRGVDLMQSLQLCFYALPLSWLPRSAEKACRKHGKAVGRCSLAALFPSHHLSPFSESQRQRPRGWKSELEILVGHLPLENPTLLLDI